MTVYVIVQPKMTDRAAYDRYERTLSEVRAKGDIAGSQGGAEAIALRAQGFTT